MTDLLIGQTLTGTEDVPVGAIAKDAEGDLWGSGPDGWGTEGGFPKYDRDNILLYMARRRYAPFVIVSLPAR